MTRENKFNIGLYFKICFISCAVISAGVSSFSFLYIDNPSSLDNRLHALGGLENPVIGALSYGAALIFAASSLVDTRSHKIKLILISGIAILLLAVLLTGTRSALVGLFAGSIVLLVSSPHFSRQNKLYITGLGFIGIGLATLFLGDSDFSRSLLERSTSFRPEIWREVIGKMTSDRLLFGYGINTSEAVRYHDLQFNHPHNIFLATLFYGGIVGLGLFIAVLIRTYYVVIKNRHNNDIIYILPLLSYGLACLLFDGNRPLEKVNFIWFLIWLPIALTIALEYKTKKV